MYSRLRVVVIIAMWCVDAYYCTFNEVQKPKPQHVVTAEAWITLQIRDFDGAGEHYNGTFTVALFGKDAPISTLNFKLLARGYNSARRMLKFRGSLIHRIVPDFIIQGGDLTHGNGEGGYSVFGLRYIDEPFVLSHRAPGWISMANHGPNSNNSQYFIILDKARWLDGKHVVFGKIIQGFDVIKILNEVPTNPETAYPAYHIEVIDSGVSETVPHYTLTEEELDSTHDLVRPGRKVATAPERHTRGSARVKVQEKPPVTKVVEEEEDVEDDRS